MMHKKYQIPLVKVLFIIILTGFLLIIFLVYLFQSSSIPQRDDYYSHTLVYNVVLSQCLPTQPIPSFDQNDLNECLSDISEDIYVEMSFLDNSSRVIEGSFYHGEEERFNELSSFCDLTQSRSCSEIRVPMVSSAHKDIRTLEIKIIT